MVIWKTVTLLFIILYLSQIVTAVDDEGNETMKRKAAETEGEKQEEKRIKLEIGGSSSSGGKDKNTEATKMEIDEEQIASQNERSNGRREYIIELRIKEISNLMLKNSSILDKHGEFTGTITKKEKFHLDTIMKILKLCQQRGVLNSTDLKYHIHEFRSSNQQIINKMIHQAGPHENSGKMPKYWEETLQIRNELMESCAKI